MDQPTLAVFDDKQRADDAVRELSRAGFLREQIAVARQLTKQETRESEAAEERSAGALASLARFVSNLLGLGAEGDGAHEADFLAGRTIVRVQADDRRQEATAILLRHGGYNRTSRP